MQNDPRPRIGKEGSRGSRLAHRAIGLAALTLALLPLSACGSTRTAAVTSSGDADAAHLASLTASGSVNQINAALSLLAPRCTENRTTVAGIVYATWKDLQTHGFHDSAATTALALAHSVPNSIVPAACDQIAAAYLVQRER
jgi:hypothetical protein